MRKAIFILGTMLALLSCEAARTWEVTVTTVTEQWNAYQHFMFASNTNTYVEVVPDMTEAEIEEYCLPTSGVEKIGNVIYKSRTTKTYREVK